MIGRPNAGLIVAATAGMATAMVPIDLPPEAHRLAALFVAVLILWVTEALPIAVTALLIPAGLVMLRVAEPKPAFAPLAHPILFLFIGGFFIARAMTLHGLDRRIAAAIVGARWAAGSPTRVRAGFMAAAVVLSMWISNTAACAILAPIWLGTVRRSGADRDPEADPTAAPAGSSGVEGGLLAIAYACSLGGLGTVVGSPPNGITQGLLQEAGLRDFDFVAWMGLGLPVALVLTVVVFVYLNMRLPAPELSGDLQTAERTPWTRGERVTALSFGLAVAGWMAPGLLKAVAPAQGAALARVLNLGAVAIVATVPLFAMSNGAARPGPVLPWREAQKIEWGLVLLFGGGLALGKQMQDTGLADALAGALVQSTGLESVWALVAVAAVFTIFFTETCSNTAAAGVLCPLIIAAAGALEVSPLAPTMAVGLAASCAFMLPIATGPNAVAFGTGRLRQRTMMREGLWLNLICAVAIVAWLRLALPPQ